MRILLGIILFTIAQVMAWFQSNSGILSEPFKKESTYALSCAKYKSLISAILGLTKWISTSNRSRASFVNRYLSLGNRDRLSIP